MSLGDSRFNALTSLLVGTATVVATVISQGAAVFAKTGPEIYQIAIPITVQINGSDTGSGSGVIIAKQGNTYTVVTNNHVVCNPENPVKCSSDITYTVRTYKGKEYRGTPRRLQKSGNDPDLAVVTFNSPDEYPVATLGNSDLAQPTVEIYIYGFPILQNRFGDQRQPEVTKGSITGRGQNEPGGYILRYTAPTWEGMSGSPVFDTDGRVIGIHGQGIKETQDVVDERGQTTGELPSKTGFNAGIPINILIAMRGQIGQSVANLIVDNTPFANSSVSLNNPNDARDYYLRGLSRFDGGNLQGSITDFSQAIQSQPNYAEAYFYRGLARLNQGDLQGSIVDYSQAIQIDRNYADAYYNRAVVRSQLGDKQGAIADYTQAIRLNDNFTAAYNNRGLIRFSLNDLQGAIADFDQALQINPNRANTYFNRGQAYYRQRSYQQALADHTEAIRLNPNYAKAYAQRGATRFRLGDKQGAIADLQTAAQLFKTQGRMADYQRVLQLMQDVQQN